jgi:hypothetical protein
MMGYGPWSGGLRRPAILRRPCRDCANSRVFFRTEGNKESEEVRVHPQLASIDSSA